MASIAFSINPNGHSGGRGPPSLPKGGPPSLPKGGLPKITRKFHELHIKSTRAGRGGNGSSNRGRGSGRGRGSSSRGCGRGGTINPYNNKRIASRTRSKNSYRRKDGTIVGNDDTQASVAVGSGDDDLRYVCDLTNTGFVLLVDGDAEVTVDCNNTPQDIATSLKEHLNDTPQVEVMIMSNRTSNWHSLADALFADVPVISALSFIRSSNFQVGALLDGESNDGVVLDLRNGRFIATTFWDGCAESVSETDDALRSLEGCSTRIVILNSAASAADSVREAMSPLPISVSNKTARSFAALACSLHTCNDYQTWFYRDDKREWESMRFEEQFPGSD